MVFDAGRQTWKARVGSRVVTAPLVAGERVFVMSVDRVVHAFDALDGRRLWALQRPGEALTLAQGGVLTSYKDTLVAGQGPRLTGIDPTLCPACGQGCLKAVQTLPPLRGFHPPGRPPP